MMFDMQENHMAAFIMELIKKFPDKFTFDIEFIETFFGNKDFDQGGEKMKKYFMKKLGAVDTKSPYYFIFEKMIAGQDWTEITKGLIDGFSLLVSNAQNKITYDIEAFFKSEDKKLEMAYNQYFLKNWGMKINDDIPGFMVKEPNDVYGLICNAFFANTVIIQKPEVFAEQINKMTGKTIFKK